MNKRSRTVIFAERDLTWSRRLRVELRRRGATVLTATSARELLQLAERQTPDLVVLDETLDEVDSVVRVELLKGRFPETEIILMGDQSFQTPHGAGLGLLYCGVRSVSHEDLLKVITAAFPDLKSSSPPQERRPARVLCVDDDVFYLRSLARLLARRGYQVTTYDDPEEALVSFPEVRPNLVILDVMMSGMSGFDLATDLQQICKEKVPIVMLTARTGDEDIAEGYRRGACYYITKPCDPRTVINIVDYLVGDMDVVEKELLEAVL